MFRVDDGTVVYSPTDLAAAATCEFALLRTLDAKLGRIPPLALEQDAMLERAARLGDRHEQAVLAELLQRYGRWDPVTGRGVVHIERPDAGRHTDAGVLRAKHAETLDALRTGADVVFQAGFFDGRFGGWADFLIREDDGRYAVHDTKLARHAKVTALLQLAAYADQLLAAGIPLTEHVHLRLGDQTVTDHRVVDLLPVYRQRRARMQAILDEHAGEDGPVAWGDDRYRACLRCEVCTPEVGSRRDVLLVAGLRTTQRARLHAAGITTIDELAASTAWVPGIAEATVTTLRAQAQLQVRQTEPTPIEFDLFAPEVVGSLPPPDPGDIFFDFEGDPLWAEEGSPDWGLEYLFGVVEAPLAADRAPAFRPFWAHDRVQERQALLDFLAYVRSRRVAHPGMHIYHYAAYEKTALLRLAGRHGVGEDEVDALLRAGLLVDLYSAVRACLRTGQRSYSLKTLEPLYLDTARGGEVTTAAQSVIEYAEACETRDAGDLAGWQARLGQIAAYNADDCISTLRLRDWLLARAAEKGVVPAARPAPEATTAPDDAGPPPEEDALAQALLTFADGDRTGTGARPASGMRTPDRQAAAMLAAALGYHWRETKPFWWAHFDRLVSHPSEWTEKRSTFVTDGVEVGKDWHVPPGKQTARRVLRMVGHLEPGSELRAGSDACALYDPPLPACARTSADGRRGWTESVTVLEVAAEDVAGGARDVLVVEDRLRRVDARHEGLPMALGPGAPPRTGGITAAIRGVAEEAVAGLPGLPAQPAVDVLRRIPPRTGGGGLPGVVDGGYVDAIVAAVQDLDRSYLAVQGPPGTGKTYTGARVIARLVERGWRIGVVAQSHAVVENMLREVARAGVPRDQLGKRPGHGEGDAGAPWRWLGDKDFGTFYADQAGGYVVGGTTWDFTNAKRLPHKELDLLVVDEAGQYSLADTVAASTAARTLLLLGDPQQLPQVSQGTHPEPVDRSALGWLTDGHDTLPDGLGYFLTHTWRMHPALCSVVSRLAYEDRLRPMPCTAERSLDGVEPGVRCVPVDHEGNAVASVEEAREVVAQVLAVVGRRWRDPAGGPSGAPVDRPLEARDVVVVAPFNAQVWTIRRMLDAAGLAGAQVGTVDKFQGRQAVVVVVSMTASSPDDVPRGMEFLLDRNRINVAISRGQWCAVVVRSPGLTEYLPSRAEQLAELGAFLAVCQA